MARPNLPSAPRRIAFAVSLGLCAVATLLALAAKEHDSATFARGLHLPGVPDLSDTHGITATEGALLGLAALSVALAVILAAKPSVFLFAIAAGWAIVPLGVGALFASGVQPPYAPIDQRFADQVLGVTQMSASVLAMAGSLVGLADLRVWPGGTVRRMPPPTHQA